MKILVLDFDLTMTDYPSANRDFFWESEQNFLNLVNCLGNASHHFNIYIVSRAPEQRLTNYIKSSKLKNYIKKVYGSNSNSRIISLPDISWGSIKLNCINDIMILENTINKDDIYFVDDLYENRYIQTCYGFKNVFDCYKSKVLINIINSIIENEAVCDLPIYNITKEKSEQLLKNSYNSYIIRKYGEDDILIISINIKGEVQHFLLIKINMYFYDCVDENDEYIGYEETKIDKLSNHVLLKKANYFRDIL